MKAVLLAFLVVGVSDGFVYARTTPAGPLLVKDTVLKPPQTNSTSAGFFDAGTSPPAAGSNDIAQLTFAGAGGPPGLNYYVDNRAPPGQTFTTGNTSSVAGGYPLTSLYVKEQRGTAGGGMPEPSDYTLRIYRVAGASATLLTAYVSTNRMTFEEGDWLVWVGLTNILQTNQTYAFSLQRNAGGYWKLDNRSGAPYAGGQAVLLPTVSGSITFSRDRNYDAAFDLKFDDSAIFIPSPPEGLNRDSGDPFTLRVLAVGQPPLGYQWWKNGVPVADATNSTYSVASAKMADAGRYDVVVSNHLNAVVSMPATINVLNLSSATNQSGLFCNLLEHPEETVISDRTPRFGWIYKPSFRNDSQAGYRIIVASSRALAEAGTGDLWDSGIVSNATSINVPYGGAPLQPNSSYFWRVRTLDSAGRLGAFSEVQQFNTASRLSDPLTTPGAVYRLPKNGSINGYPLRYVQAAPVVITHTGTGHWFIDFGQDAFGYVSVHLNGSFRGTNVEARFGEKARGEAVDTAPGATIRYGSTTFTLQNGDVTYEVRAPADRHGVNPPASYGNVMPFRYLELIGCPGALSVTDVVQQRLVSEFDPAAASFSSSSTALDRIWTLCRDSMHWLTFDGIYVDGDRERRPYEADAYLQQLSSYAVDNQFTLPRCSFEYLTTHGTWPTEWKFHMVLIAWADYQQTGDPYLLEKYYGILTNRCLLNHARADGLISGEGGNDIVDWPAGERDGYDMKPTYKAVINAFYYRCMRIMTQVARRTGHAADAADFAARADRVYRSFNTVFWNSRSHCYIDGEGSTHSSAHANFFALAFGLVPAGRQAAVVDFLHSRVAAYNGGMPCSVYGAQYLLEGLYEAGDADQAFHLITANSKRSWLNMLNVGSTLTLEAWDRAYKENLDWNHAWGAAAGNIIACYILGLRPLEAGFGRVLIQPQMGESLSRVQGTVPTIRGPVFIRANNAPAQFRLLVDIPGNVTATVMLPAARDAAIVDGAVVSGSYSNHWLTVTNIGSGWHALWTGATNTPSRATLYSNWASSWFGTNADNPAIAGRAADPDHDGTNNLTEFLDGTQPIDDR